MDILDVPCSWGDVTNFEASALTASASAAASLAVERLSWRDPCSAACLRSPMS